MKRLATIYIRITCIYLSFSEDPELQKKEVKKKRKKAVVIALGALGGGALIGMLWDLHVYINIFT